MEGILLQHSLILCTFLHPADVGALVERPRAIDNRPYGFYRRFCVFCNTFFARKDHAFFRYLMSATVVVTTAISSANREVEPMMI